MALVAVGVLAVAGVAGAGYVEKPGYGVENTIDFFKVRRNHNVIVLNDLKSRCGGRVQTTNILDAYAEAGVAAGAEKALHESYPGTTFSCFSYSGVLVDGADSFEFSNGKPWKQTFQGYGGITYVLNYLEYPMITARGTLGDKFIQVIVDVDKKTIDFVDSNLALNVTGAGIGRGANSAISENQLNRIMKKAYMALYGPNPITLVGVGWTEVIPFMNGLLANDDKRKAFVSEVIPGLLERARILRESEPW